MGPSCSQLTKLPPKENERQNGCTILYQGIVLLLACPCRWWAACQWLCFALAFAAAGALCAACLLQIPVDINLGYLE